jgi:hypothetical protein
MPTNHKQNTQQDRPEGITCPHYEALTGRRHCRHYLGDAACSMPDELICSEWIKANGLHRATPSRVASVNARRAEERLRKLSETSPLDMFGHPNPHYKPPAEREGPTDLFGNPVHEPKKPKRTTPTQKRSSAPRPPSKAMDKREPLPGLTAEDIDSFKKLGVEVCLDSKAFGELWLVPAYTGTDRKEITPEHAATIARVLEAFSGSEVVSFEKSPKPNKETE